MAAAQGAGELGEGAVGPQRCVEAWQGEVRAWRGLSLLLQLLLLAVPLLQDWAWLQCSSQSLSPSLHTHTHACTHTGGAAAGGAPGDAAQQPLPDPPAVLVPRLQGPRVAHPHGEAQNVSACAHLRGP